MAGKLGPFFFPLSSCNFDWAKTAVGSIRGAEWVRPSVVKKAFRSTESYIFHAGIQAKTLNSPHARLLAQSVSGRKKRLRKENPLITANQFGSMRWSNSLSLSFFTLDCPNLTNDSRFAAAPSVVTIHRALGLSMMMRRILMAVMISTSQVSPFLISHSAFLLSLKSYNSVSLRPCRWIRRRAWIYKIFSQLRPGRWLGRFSLVVLRRSHPHRLTNELLLVQRAARAQPPDPAAAAAVAAAAAAAARSPTQLARSLTHSIPDGWMLFVRTAVGAAEGRWCHLEARWARAAKVPIYVESSGRETRKRVSLERHCIRTLTHSHSQHAQDTTFLGLELKAAEQHAGLEARLHPGRPKRRRRWERGLGLSPGAWRPKSRSSRFWSI